MIKDINEMDGYEFEGLIAELLRKMGFIVEQTPLSGDGGVDLIAYFKEPLFMGKYLIQCKCWKGSVGEPPVRDLFGVVISNNANKGVLVTNSYFTQQAKEFAEGKNIELINGDLLNKLIQKYYLNSTTKKTAHFLNCNEFEYDKYRYLKSKMETETRNFAACIDYFRFMYSNIKNKRFQIMYSGLIEECISISEKITEIYGKKRAGVRFVFDAFRGIFLMLLGKTHSSFELIHNNKRLDFNLNDFTDRLIIYLYFNPEHFNLVGQTERYDNEVEDRELIIYKSNLLKLLIRINDNYSSEWLRDRFIGYYKSVIKKANEIEPTLFDIHNREQKIDVANKNYNLAAKHLSDVFNNRDLEFYIPTDFNIDNKYPIFSGLKYETGIYIGVDDLQSYWSLDLDFEKQKEKIKFLISLNDSIG